MANQVTVLDADGKPYKRLVATKDDLKKIKEFAQQGFSSSIIAAQLRVTTRTLEKWLDEDNPLQYDPRVAVAMQSGLADHEQKMVEKTNSVLFGDTSNRHWGTMMIFMFKARHGYVDRPQYQPVQNNTTVVLPGSYKVNSIAPQVSHTITDAKLVEPRMIAAPLPVNSDD